MTKDDRREIASMLRSVLFYAGRAGGYGTGLLEDARVRAAISEFEGDDWWATPSRECEKCKHRVGDHHRIMGCQHLTPVYSEGWLRQHDRCECKSHVESERGAL